MKKYPFSLFILFTFIGSSSFCQNYLAPKATNIPTIDGIGNEACWQEAGWAAMDQVWIGNAVTANDFSGKYKVAWTADKLYLLVEVTDDVLSDYYANPLQNWWDDDCVEVFLDENHSGGNHQYNYNAFAYHVSTLYDAVDLGTDQNPHLYNDHFTTKRTKNGNIYTWEMAITLYTDAFVYGALNNPTATLAKSKLIGFSLAYCDNDGGTTRENFIGSKVLAPADKNNSYINASLFGTVELVEASTTNIIENYEEQTVIYPNPSNGKISLKMKGNSGPASVEISDIFNRVVLQQKNISTADASIDVNSLENGLYFVRVRNENFDITKRIVVEK